MKKLNITICIRGMLKPVATLSLFLVFLIHADAQVFSVNKLTTPASISSAVAFNPGIITGTEVIITDNGGSKCPNINYEWQSASDIAFTKDLKSNLAATKDYNPGNVTRTTYFRRVVSVQCTDPERSAKIYSTSVNISIH